MHLHLQQSFLVLLLLLVPVIYHNQYGVFLHLRHILQSYNNCLTYSQVSHGLNVRLLTNSYPLLYRPVLKMQNKQPYLPVHPNEAAHLHALLQIIRKHVCEQCLLQYLQTHSRHNSVCRDNLLHIYWLKYFPLQP